MKRFFTPMLVSICSQFYAQTISSIDVDKKYNDSLAKIVETTKNDSIKSLLSFDLVGQFMKENNIEKMELYLKIGNKYSKNYEYLRDCSGYFNAMKFLNTNELDSFASLISKTQKKLIKHKFYKSYKIQSLIFQNLSTYSSIRGNKKEAIRILIEDALPVAIKAGNEIMIANLYKGIATDLVNVSEREKANLYYLKALKYLKNIKSKDPFLKETEIDIKIDYAYNLLNLDKLSDAKILINQVHYLLEKHPESNLNLLYFRTNGFYNHKIKNYNEALKQFNKGISLIGTDKKMNQYELRLLNSLKFETLFELKQYDSAKVIIKNLLEIKDLNNYDKKSYSLKLSKVLEKEKDFENAYFQIKKNIQYNDSIVREESKSEIMFLESKFNTVENINKIKELEIQKQKSLITSKNNQLLFILLGFLSTIFLLIIFFLFKNQKYHKKLSKQKDLIHNQKILQLKNQKEVAVLQAMIDGEELERKRVARDLHDSIGSKLSSLKILFSRLYNSKTYDDEIQKLEVLLDESIKELRQVSYNLVPESLLKLGLENALTDLCYSLNSEELKIDSQLFGISKKLSESTQTNIFRIVQELVNNSLKHSKCSEILVACSQNKNTFFISVEDNGIGFNCNDLEKKSGLGIKNIKNRVDILNGTFNCESDSSGTYINIELEV